MPLNGKFLDKSGLTYFWSKLKDLFSGKVDKETGKGLSTNDYTTSEKTKLSGIETGATKTVVDSAMSSSSANPVQNRVINTALAGKQNTLTFDSTPTQSSTNPVTSGGVYTDQQRQETEIGVVANAGVKNLLEVTSQTQTIDDVTFTVNADQTITVNGTNNTQNAITYVIVSNDRAVEIPDGEYILSGCPQGGGTSTYDLRWYLYSSGKSAYDNGSGATVNKNGNTASSNIAIIIKAGVTVSNIVFKPMIRRAEVTDSTFVPYAPTNRKLYEACETKVTMQQAYGDAILIPANSDLKNYTTPGIYYVLVANAPTIANTPYRDTGFRLVVEKNTPSGAAVFQTIYPTSRSHLEFFRRVYEGNVWSSWYKFEGTPVTT